MELLYNGVQWIDLINLKDYAEVKMIMCIIEKVKYDLWKRVWTALWGGTVFFIVLFKCCDTIVKKSKKSTNLMKRYQYVSKKECFRTRMA